MSPVLFVRALYDFDPNDPSSLSFKKNDIIRVLSQLESGWWDGLCNDERGWFPSNYVTVIDKEGEMFDENDELYNWVHQQTSDGEIFYYNIKTGESSWVPINDNKPLRKVHTARQLPENWIQQSTEDGNTYYHNVITKETRSIYPESSISSDTDDEKLDSYLKDDLEGVDTAEKLPPNTNGQLTKTENNGKSGSDDEMPNEPLPPTSIPYTSKRISEQSIFMLQNANEYLTWDSLSQSIDLSIHNLYLAVQENLRQDYPDCTNTIVGNVRIMLYASGTIEKDSVAIKQNKSLRIYHRNIMASLSKLVLSAKVAASEWPPIDAAERMRSDAIEVLDAVRKFILIAQQIVDIRRVDPRIIESVTGGSWHGNNSIQIQTNGNKSPNTSSINGDNVASKSSSYHLTPELINFLDKISRAVTQSVVLLLNYVRKVIDVPNSSLSTPQLISQTKEVLTQVGQFLSIIEGIDLKDLDESSIDTINEFNVAKQALYNNITRLVICVQTATDPLFPLNSVEQILVCANVVDKSVKDIIIATKFLLVKIQGMRSRRPSAVEILEMSKLNNSDSLDQINGNDSVNFVENQPLATSSDNTNPPTSKSSSDNTNPPTSKSSSDNTNPPVFKSSSDDTNPPASKSSSDDTNLPVSKSSSDDTNPPVPTSSSDDTNPPVSKSSSDNINPPVSTSSSNNANPPVSTSSSDNINPPVSTSSSNNANPSVSKSSSDNINLPVSSNSLTPSSDDANSSISISSTLSSDNINSSDPKPLTLSSDNTSPPVSKSSKSLPTVPEDGNLIISGKDANHNKDDVPISPNSTSGSTGRLQRSYTQSSTLSADSSSSQNGNNTGGAKFRAKLTNFFGEDVSSNITQSQKPKEDKPWFLDYDYDSSEMVFSMESTVKGGTLSALIERLTMHDLLDSNFIATFLLTYRSFCTTDDFFDMLVKRFMIQPPDSLTPEELDVWQEKKQTPVRLRVFNIMKTWLESYYIDDEDLHCLEKMREFARTTMHEHMAFAAVSLTKVIEKRQQQRKDAKFKELVVTNSLAPPAPILPKNIKKLRFLDIDPLEIARQLTLIESKLYNQIKPVECLGKAWSQSEGDNVAVNIKAMIVNSNKITGWVAESVLNQKEIRKRCLYIKHFVAVADKCRCLNNFNSLTAITSGLYSAPIHRLKRTWEMVNARTAQTLESLSRIMNSTKNFAEYREMLHSINPPCVPFFGLYLTDLTFIEDGNPDFLKNSNQLINFSKRMKTADVIREIQQYQSAPYNLNPVQEIQTFIRCHLQDSRDVKDLYDQSLTLEPREREDEKIARLLQESGFL